MKVKYAVTLFDMFLDEQKDVNASLPLDESVGSTEQSALEEQLVDEEEEATVNPEVSERDGRIYTLVKSRRLTYRFDDGLDFLKYLQRVGLSTYDYMYELNHSVFKAFQRMLEVVLNRVTSEDGEVDVDKLLRELSLSNLVTIGEYSYEAHDLLRYHIPKNQRDSYKDCVALRVADREYYCPLGAYIRRNYDGKLRMFRRTKIPFRLANLDYALYEAFLYSFIYQFFWEACENDENDHFVMDIQESMDELLSKVYAHGKDEFIVIPEDNGALYQWITSKGVMCVERPAAAVSTSFELNELMSKFYITLGDSEQLSKGYRVTSRNMMLRLIEKILNRYERDEYEKEFERNEATDYARSWEEKKNISQKYRDAMQTSKFREWFSYVEYDQDCDLDVMSALSDEFVSLMDVLKVEKMPDISLRFRLLGNHKAKGLYVPSYKCVCVDLHYPSSFLHEFAHMFDHMNGDLSTRHDFQKLYDRYSSIVTERVGKNPDLKKSLKGKYNLKYYLRDTEVFARCAEMYFARIRGLESSLVPLKDELSGFEYPLDERLDELISAYFGQWFNDL